MEPVGKRQAEAAKGGLLVYEGLHTDTHVTTCNPPSPYQACWLQRSKRMHTDTHVTTCNPPSPVQACWLPRSKRMGSAAGGGGALNLYH